MSVVNTIFNHVKTRLVACCTLQGVPKKADINILVIYSIQNDKEFVKNA